MSQERVIVVGAGGISGAWFPNIVKEKLNVVAVVDLNIDNARRQIEKYQLAGAAAEADLDSALQKHRADFLIDLTIPEAHSGVTCKALAAGLHVIGEKPMAATMDQARDMVRASESSGKMFMVSQSRRWDANHSTLARVLRNNGIGRLTTVNCDFFIGAHFGGFRDEMASPLILDMAIHHFDQVRLFTGLDGVSVYCEEWNPAGSWYKGDVSAVCIFELTGGVRFVYRGSWCAEGCHTSWDGDWRFIGTGGTINYVGNKLNGQRVAGTEKSGLFLPLAPIPIELDVVDKTGMHGGLDEMLRFIRTGKTPQTECHDNIKSLAMVHAAIESSRSGKRVKIA
jgi:predicted dehydrogenase